MGIINKNVIASDRNLFIEYNELQRLLDLFSSSVQEDALKKEFIAWHRLQDLFFNICSNLVGIHYYRGSAVGVINSFKLLELQKAHINLYKNDRMLMGLVNVIPVDGINDFINNRLIIEQLQRQCDIEEQNMKDNPDFYNHEFYELLDSIRKNVDRLPKILDEWLLKRNEYISHVNDELTYNQLIHNTDKAFISMLAMIPTEN